jgi:hypothetical protein
MYTGNLKYNINTCIQYMYTVCTCTCTSKYWLISKLLVPIIIRTCSSCSLFDKCIFWFFLVRYMSSMKNEYQTDFNTGK